MQNTYQLTFDLGFSPTFGDEDFFISPSNSQAVNWISKWPHWPAPLLIIYGLNGCGKTHLAQIWKRKAGARNITYRDIKNQKVREMLKKSPTFVLEDADKNIDAEALFNLYNILKEDALNTSGEFGLITASAPPSQWDLSLKDILTRLNTLPMAEIGAPDDALLAAVLVKLFSDRQLRVSSETVLYILKRLDRSFEAVRRFVEAVDHASLAKGRPITVPFVKEILLSQK